MNTLRLTALLALAALLAAAPTHAQLSVQWITKYGTTAGDTSLDIVVDALGQSWVGGTAGSFDPFNPGFPGPSNLLLGRVSPTGSVDFTQQRGGPFDEYNGWVALVGSGTVFINGITASGTFDSAPALGNFDALAVRYDTNGNWQQTIRYGGTNADYGQGLAGNTTNLLIAGSTFSSFDGGTVSPATSSAFLSKRDSTGAVIWTRFLGNPQSTSGTGAAFDGGGNAYMAGSTNGSLSGFTNAGGNDGFIARYDSGGTQTLLKQFGSSLDDFARRVVVDVSGNIYISGNTAGALGGQTNQGNVDAFVMKLDSAGNVLWTRLLGGSGDDYGLGLSLDAGGNVWTSGSTLSTFGGHTNAGGRDGFVAEYDSNGTLLATLFLSSPADDTVSAVTIGPDGGAYVTGTTAGTLGGAVIGGTDVFVAKIVPEPTAALLLAGAAFPLLARRRRGR